MNVYRLQVTSETQNRSVLTIARNNVGLELPPCFRKVPVEDIYLRDGHVRHHERPELIHAVGPDEGVHDNNLKTWCGPTGTPATRVSGGGQHFKRG